MIFASLIASVIPMSAYLFLIWKMDRYEPEPLKFVLYHFIWGAFGAVLLSVIGSKLLSIPLELMIIETTKLSFLQTILIAPFVEELTKGAFLFRTVNDKRFDNLTDGLVYGGAIGLGFGMTENFLYFIAYGTTLESWISIVIIRSGFSAVMHCMAIASFGAMLAISKFSTGIKKRLLPYFGLGIAMFIHFIWNFSVSFSNTYLLGLLFILIILSTFIIVFSYSLNNERKIISSELVDEVPPKHILILSSKLRDKKGWIAEPIRKKYIKNATKLAFRKMQSIHFTKKKKEYYDREIEILRKNIKELLNYNYNFGK